MDDELLGIAVFKDKAQTGVSPTIRPTGTAAEKPCPFWEMRTSRCKVHLSNPNDGYLLVDPAQASVLSISGNEFCSALCPDSPSVRHWNGDSNPILNKLTRQYSSYSGPEEMSTQHLLLSNTLGASGQRVRNDVVARIAPAPQGPWSAEQMLVSPWQMPAHHAPTMQPLVDGKDALL